MYDRRYHTLSLRISIAATLLCSASLSLADENEITGTNGDDLLVGTPATDHFFGGHGADVFVLNHLSANPDVIFDFDPEEGDSLELAFGSERTLPFQQKDFSINRKGVVTIKIGADKQDLVKLNRTDLKLKLDSRKGRYFLSFSKKF